MRATDERARDSRNRQSEILVSRLTKKLKLSSTTKDSPLVLALESMFIESVRG